MAGGRTEPGSRRRARAESAVVPLPRSAVGDRLDLVRLVPSGRSLSPPSRSWSSRLGGYWVARRPRSSPYRRSRCVERRPQVAREVQRLDTDVRWGQASWTVDAAAIEGSVRALPSVAAASVDRAFPHTLVIRVAPVWPVGVARRGARRLARERIGPRDTEIEPRAEPGLAQALAAAQGPVSSRTVAAHLVRAGHARLRRARDVRIPGR